MAGLLGFAHAYPALTRALILEAVAIAIGLTLAFAGARRRSCRYQHALDELDALAAAEG